MEKKNKFASSIFESTKRKCSMGFRTKGVVIGDFVTHTIHEGSWMITDIVFNYELNVRQARIIKVGNPRDVHHVDPATLSVIKKTF